MVNAVVDLTSRLQFLELYTVCRQPLAVRVLVCKLVLNLTVVVYLSFLRVDEQNLARLQASLLGDLRRVEVHHADLRRHDHGVVLGDGVPCRAQTVTVEHAAGIASVGEQQCCRSVPRLHQYGVVLVEGLQVLGDRVLVVEAFRYHDGHGLWQRQSAHDEELEDIVEACRVGHTRLYDRRYLTDVAQGLRREH